MTMRNFTVSIAVALCGVLATCLTAAGADSSQPLRVITTIPDLADIARKVGGDRVDASSITKGPEDPHFSQPKPSLIRALSDADALVLIGMDLEVGYVPVLLRNARNARVLPGASGHIDASTAIVALEIPTGVVDRSMGDVHTQGNPHYMVDPLNGLKVAALLRDRFSAIRPAEAERFERGYAEFRRQLAIRLVGESLAGKYDPEPLLKLLELGRFHEFLSAQGDAERLGGWIAMLQPYAGMSLVADHRLWPYFARRFGLAVFGEMEPVPGIPPTTRHLQGLVARMRDANVKVIAASPYYDPRHARFLADATGASIARLAHQVGAVPEADDYLSLIDYNVRRLAAAFAEHPQN